MCQQQKIESKNLGRIKKILQTFYPTCSCLLVIVSQYIKGTYENVYNDFSDNEFKTSGK